MTPTTRVWPLALSLALGCGGAVDAPKLDIALGGWEGTTSQDAPISLRIEEAGVVEAVVAYQALCLDAVTSLTDDPQPIVRNRLFFEDDFGFAGGDDIRFTFAGLFDSETSASGTLQLVASRGGEYFCAGEEKLEWSVRWSSR